MRLSLEQFLEKVDFEMESGLAGTLSTGDKKVHLWNVIAEEEKRVAALSRDFDYRFVLTPTVEVLALPFALAFGVRWKIEGEGERKPTEKWKGLPWVMKLFSKTCATQ